LIVACSALLACAIVVGTGILIANLRAGALANTERELRNTALILAEQTARSFEGLELVESGLVERMNKIGIASSPAAPLSTLPAPGLLRASVLRTAATSRRSPPTPVWGRS
jgi:hypothetical protein